MIKGIEIQSSYFLSLLILILLILSCSTAPEFERENQNDPTSSNFVPDVSEFSVTINSDKIVSLVWKDDSNYESGFIISKSFGSDSSFFVMDSIPANSNSYTDISKQLDLVTYYKISALNNSTDPNDLPGVVKKVDFGKIGSASVEGFSNEISIDFALGDSFADKFLIEKRQPEAQEWTLVDTVSTNTEEYSFSDNTESYFIDVRISSLLSTYKEDSKIIDSVLFKLVEYNYPTDFNVSFINEAQVEISFTDQSSFDDEFILSERNKDGCNHCEFNEFMILDTLGTGELTLVTETSNDLRQFSLHAISNSISSNKITTKVFRTSSASPRLDNTSFSAVSDGSVSITWTDINNIPQLLETYRYEIQLYDDDENVFIKEIILPRTHREIILDSLNQSINYRLEIWTYSSGYPSEIKFSYKTTIEEVNSYNIAPNSGSKNVQILAKHSKVAFSQYQAGLSGIRIFDLNNLSFETISDNSENHPDFNISSIEDFVISNDLNLIATNRVYNKEDNGLKSNWLFVADRTTGENEYFKTKGPDELHHDRTRLIGFSSDSEIIYVSDNTEIDIGSTIYKWNFKTDEYKVLFESENYFDDIFLDQDNGLILLGGFFSLFKLDLNGSLLFNAQNDFLDGSIREISQSSFSNSYNLKIIGNLYRYNASENTISQIYTKNNIDSFFEIPEYDLLTTYFRNELVLYSLNSEIEIYSINDFQNELEFQNGAYIPGLDQVLLQRGSEIRIYDLITDWVPVDFNCC